LYGLRSGYAVLSKFCRPEQGLAKHRTEGTQPTRCGGKEPREAQPAWAAGTPERPNRRGAYTDPACATSYVSRRQGRRRASIICSIPDVNHQQY
jgi:hypothetical protein